MSTTENKVPEVTISLSPWPVWASACNLAETTIINRPSLARVFQVCFEDEVLISQEVMDSVRFGFDDNGYVLCKALSPFDYRGHWSPFGMGRLAGLVILCRTQVIYG